MAWIKNREDDEEIEATADVPGFGATSSKEQMTSIQLMITRK